MQKCGCFWASTDSADEKQNHRQGQDMTRHHFILLAASLGVLPAAFAGDYEEALQCHERREYARAAALFRKAAAQGMPKAQLALAVMYDAGQGVEKDHNVAMFWYQRAADHGHAPAQYNLALIYDAGKGVGQDHRKARFWYGKAAEQGFAAAQANLGVLYAEGRGVDRDAVEAHKWWTIAAKNGHEPARTNCAIIEGEMTPSQIVEAQQRAAAWLKTHGR
jgi:TPR repeat protein